MSLEIIQSWPNWPNILHILQTNERLFKLETKLGSCNCTHFQKQTFCKVSVSCPDIRWRYPKLHKFPKIYNKISGYKTVSNCSFQRIELEHFWSVKFTRRILFMSIFILKVNSKKMIWVWHHLVYEWNHQLLSGFWRHHLSRSFCGIVKSIQICETATCSLSSLYVGCMWITNGISTSIYRSGPNPEVLTLVTGDVARSWHSKTKLE